MKSIKLILLGSALFTVTGLYTPALASAQTMKKTKASSSQSLTETEKHMLFVILANTHELQIHRMRGADENQVYTNNKDGREAVFDADGKLVKDNINDGTYNYANAVTDPFGHFDLDMSPWIMMGISRTDPTDKQERINAYMTDLQSGIIRGWQAWPKESKKAFKPGKAQSNIPDAWVQVFKDPAAREVFNLMQGDEANMRKKMPETLNAIHKNLLKYYSKR